MDSVSNKAKDLGDAVVDRETGEIVETPLDAFRRSAGFQIMFVLHSGLEVSRAVDHLCASAEKFRAAMHEWKPIETAPADGLFLVYMPNEPERRQIQVANWHPNVKVTGHVFAFDLSPATLWMPLPSSPCLSISDDTQPGKAS